MFEKGDEVVFVKEATHLRHKYGQMNALRFIGTIKVNGKSANGGMYTCSNQRGYYPEELELANPHDGKTRYAAKLLCKSGNIGINIYANDVKSAVEKAERYMIESGVNCTRIEVTPWQ